MGCLDVRSDLEVQLGLSPVLAMALLFYFYFNSIIVNIEILVKYNIVIQQFYILFCAHQDKAEVRSSNFWNIHFYLPQRKFLYLPIYFLSDFIYLFGRDRDSQREREHKQGEWERKKQAPSKEPDAGLDPMPGSRPEPKADA